MPLTDNASAPQCTSDPVPITNNAALCLALSLSPLKGEIAKAKQALPIYNDVQERIIQTCRQVSSLTVALSQCLYHCASAPLGSSTQLKNPRGV